MRNILASGASGVEFDPSKRRLSCPLITDDCHSGKKVFELLMQDIPPTQVTAILNEYRANVHHEPPVSRGAVMNFIDRSSIIDKSKRQKRKSGSQDKDSQSAKARKTQSTMTLDRFKLGDTENPADWDRFATVGEDVLKPLWLPAMVAWDEKHANIRLGPGGNTEYRVSVLDGVPVSPSDGGEFPPRHSVTTVMQPSQGRAAFGSSVRET